MWRDHLSRIVGFLLDDDQPVLQKNHSVSMSPRSSLHCIWVRFKVPLDNLSNEFHQAFDGRCRIRPPCSLPCVKRHRSLPIFFDKCLQFLPLRWIVKFLLAPSCLLFSVASQGRGFCLHATACWILAEKKLNPLCWYWSKDKSYKFAQEWASEAIEGTCHVPDGKNNINNEIIFQNTCHLSPGKVIDVYSFDDKC